MRGALKTDLYQIWIEMIEILLPVYNGEKYLAEQIESILAQTYNEWILKIRNDGSKDGSQAIIDRYCNTYPDKIVMIDSPKENVGLVQSINYLQAAEPHGDYIMFADQDDVWLPDKLEVSINEIKTLEKDNLGKPAMICTDATCVDANLNVINPSFFESQRFPYDTFDDVNKMIALNVIQGCTITINRHAVKYIFPMPLIMSIHDMWIGVNCTHFGKIKYLHHSTILYRQHLTNVAGSIDVSLKYYFYRLKNIAETFGFILRMKKHLQFNIRIDKIFYYKIKYMFSRI